MQKGEKKPLTIGELQKKYHFPSQNHTFEIEPTKGIVSGFDAKGSFTVKTLTLEEEARYLAEVNGWVYSSTNGNPSGISPGVYEYIDMKTFLKYAVIDAPEWWWDFSEEPVDMNVLTEVYIKATKFKEKLEKILLQDKKEDVEKEVKKDVKK